MGETRVDLIHLLEDLRDAYPGSLEETILTEIVANSLDSGARTLRLATEAAGAVLVAIDDGTGMARARLRSYHDLAATSKRRGRGIGFAGVGIKLGLLACDEVVTESRSGSDHLATSWRLSGRTRAPWSWIQPPGWLDESAGTAVALRLSNALSPLLDPGFLEATILRNFQPLFEPELIDILIGPYPEGLKFVIDGRVVVGPIRAGERVPLSIRIGRQRKPSAVGYIARHAEALPEAERGLAISTLGKVIRRGWDWLGLTPAEADHIEGLIEVPALAEALTLNKGDFLRTGSRGATFLAYRKAIQETVSAQLEAWGAEAKPRARPSRMRPIERDLHRVLGDLAADFPLLATLAERRSGGQRRLPLGAPDANREGPWSSDATLHGLFAAPTPPTTAESEPTPGTSAAGSGASAPPPPAEPRTPEPTTTERRPESDLSGVHPPGPVRRKKRAKLSLEISFESRPGELDLGRLIESTIWVNDAHPAYRRAMASRSEGYHVALTVATALAPLTVEPARNQEFVNAFLARWGEAAVGGTRGRRNGS